MELSLYKDFVPELKTEWNTLLAESIVHVPFLRYEYLSVWWQTRGGGEWGENAQLAIITARKDGQLIGIAPFFCADREGVPTLLLIGSIEISDYLDLMARPEDLPAFSEALLPFLEAQRGHTLPDWQRMELYNVLDTSPSIEILERAAGQFGWKFQKEPFRPSLSIALPGDWETYLAGIDKKQRHEIRRKVRRAYAGDQEVRWYIARDAATLDAEIVAFLDLMAQDPEKATFLSPAMRENFRMTMRCAFDAGCLMLAFLEIGGKKAAAYFNFDYLNQLWVYNSGMDTGFPEYSPGWVLLAELLKWANENGREAFDFMRGDEDYKIRFGAQKRDVMRVMLEKGS